MELVSLQDQVFKLSKVSKEILDKEARAISLKSK
jgi:hypothetical protein